MREFISLANEAKKTHFFRSFFSFALSSRKLIKVSGTEERDFHLIHPTSFSSFQNHSLTSVNFGYPSWTLIIENT